ncbi:MAG: beta-aspartyl-peptidase [Gemmatimonadota bacterium]
MTTDRTETAAPLLIRDADVYAPEPLGRRDVFCAGGAVVALEPELTLPASLGVRVVEAGGRTLVPGLIDGHVHIAGAGGEGGPATRTPEVPLSRLVEGGITTVVGLLGADGATRTVESVLMKARALRAEGLSTWIWTGAYPIPTPTLTGDVTRDLVLFEEVIGAGEIAISDHRSSSPSVQELVQLAKAVRLGGLLGRKSGLVHLHLGDAEDPYRPIRDAVATSELTFRQFHPTHANRSRAVFEEAKRYARQATVDITTAAWAAFPDEEVKPARALRELLDAGVPLEHVTFTSDAGGSLPQFDTDGRLIALTTGRPDSLWREARDAVREEGFPLEEALLPVTATPARLLHLPGKGRIGAGADTDLRLLDDLEPSWVVARGRPLMEEGVLIARGTFE